MLKIQGNDKLSKAFKRFLIPLVILVVIMLMLVRNVLAAVEEDYWGYFYNDGTWEYEYGFMHYYDNGGGSPYNLYLGTIPDNMTWTDADERVNFRDRAKGTHYNDNRGWIYWKTEWQTSENINKYKGVSGNGSYGYSEYTSNSYNPLSAFGAPSGGGIQDGGSKIYWGNNTWNRYRRAALKFYYRDLPNPYHGQQYIPGTQTSTNEGSVGQSNYVHSGSTLWVQPNKSILLRSWAYDLYNNAYGQTAQYAGNIRSTTFYVSDSSKGYSIARTVDHKTNGTSIYNALNSHPTSVTSSRSYWNGYTPGAREIYNGLYRNGNGAEMTLSLPNNLSLNVKTDHQNKQGRWTNNSGKSGDGWNATFYSPSGAASLLKTDGDAPTITEAHIENLTSTGFDVVITGLTDNAGVGVKNIQIPTWTSSGGQDDIKWYTVATTGGNVRQRVNIADHKNEDGQYIIHIYPEDKLGNTAFRKELFVNVEASKPDLNITNSIVNLTNDTAVTKLAQGKQYRVKSIVSNIGTASSPAALTTVKDNSNRLIATFNANALPRGGVAPTYYSIFTAPDTTGAYSVISTVDSDSAISELREDNNIATFNASMNVKPIAQFTVMPSISMKNETLVYNNTSYDSDGSIKTESWSYRRSKDESGNALATSWTSGKPSSLSQYGEYEIRLMVQDNDDVWSTTPCVRTVKVSKADLIIKELKILDFKTDTEPTYLLQGEQYRIKAIVKNIGEVSSEANIIRFSNPSNIEIGRANVPVLSSTQETILILPYTQEAFGSSYTVNAMVDYANAVTELREDNNTESMTRTLQVKDLITDSVILKDDTGNVVNSMIQGYTYSANITSKNSGTIAISENFNIGLEVNDILQSTKKNITGLTVGTSSSTGMWTLTPSVNTVNPQLYKFEGITDIDNTVWETYENNNSKTSTLNAYYQNLKPTSIDIVGLNDDTPVSQLQQGKQYRVKFGIQNDGQTNIGSFYANVTETVSNTSIGTVNISSLNANTSIMMHYMTFTANGRGNMSFEVFADNGNNIRESNETDNKLSVGKTGYRLNLRATKIDIVGSSDIISKNPLTQNLQYRAAITVQNDGDADIENSVVALYENSTSAVSSAIKIGTSTVSITKGASEVIYINFTSLNRGDRTFIGVADDSNIIDESDELDNETFTNRAINKINIRAVIMDIQDNKGVTQTVLEKGQNYNAKIQLINDGDINIGAFNLGLYDNDVKIASLPISSLNKSGTPTVYTVPFTPQNGGTRTFKAFADDKLQIAESIETDNQLSSVLSVNLIQLVNYRITSIVNAPNNYTYPLDITKMPVEVKGGYNVTFQIDVIGNADSVTADFTDNSGLNNKIVTFTKVSAIDPLHSVWEATLNTDMNTPLGTIIYSTVVGVKGTVTYNYNTANSWDGQTLFIKGSALEDFNINRIY